MAAVRGAPTVAMNIVVLAELLEGFRRGTRLERNLSDLGAFRSSPRFLLLDLDEATAEPYALIVGQLRRAGTPIPTNDVWIAASALQHGCVVLTTDRHFLDVPSVSVRHFPLETGSAR
jgi:predicted nucleic acid-binding protein